MKYRCSVHFGDRDEKTAYKIAQKCANLLNMEVFLVKDPSPVPRPGLAFTPQRNKGEWAKE